MGWRIVVIDSISKISYKAGYLIVKREDDVLIPLVEIDVLLLSTPRINITGVAITELIKNKIKIIFCDEKRNPIGETSGLYDYYCSSKKIQDQFHWRDEAKEYMFTIIIKQKILNQASLLEKNNKIESSKLLRQYAKDVQPGDLTNREGHSAKVYFDSLFADGNQFNRRVNSDINSALNYGYSIILSYVNREVVANGYLTQIGLKHCNQFNDFNLSCDLMEPFRVLIDDYVLSNNNSFNGDYKNDMVKLLTKEIYFDGQKTILSNAISASVKSVLNVMESLDFQSLKLYEF